MRPDGADFYPRSAIEHTHERPEMLWIMERELSVTLGDKNHEVQLQIYKAARWPFSLSFLADISIDFKDICFSCVTSVTDLKPDVKIFVPSEHNAGHSCKEAGDKRPLL